MLRRIKFTHHYYLNKPLSTVRQPEKLVKKKFYHILVSFLRNISLEFQPI